MRHSATLHFPDGRVEAGSRAWYDIKADASEIMIYDEIGRGYYGGGITAEQFIGDLKGLNIQADGAIRLRINSPGGDLYDANAIYNYLRSQPYRVDVVIDAVAASAATLIAMAGDTISMPDNAVFVIHNPWAIAAGDAHAHRKLADNLDTLREGMIAAYLSRSGDRLPRDELIGMLDAETCLSAQDALDKGFADEILEPVRMAALLKFDLSDYGLTVPESIQALKRKQLERRAELRAQVQARKLAAGAESPQP